MAEDTSGLDVAALEARLAAATPGPWENTGSTVIVQETPLCEWLLNTEPDADITPAERADAEFIAHARTDVPALLAALRAAEGEVAALREARQGGELCRACMRRCRCDEL